MSRPMIGCLILTLRSEHIPMWFPASSKSLMSECFIYCRFDKVDSVDELVKQLQIKTGPEWRGIGQKKRVDFPNLIWATPI